MKIMLVPNMSASLEATSVAEAHLPGQFTFDEQNFNTENPRYTEQELKGSHFQMERTGFITKVNLNREQCVKVIPPSRKPYKFECSKASQQWIRRKK
jgi:hypothetical protein